MLTLRFGSSDLNMSQHSSRSDLSHMEEAGLSASEAKNVRYAASQLGINGVINQEKEYDNILRDIKNKDKFLSMNFDQVLSRLEQASHAAENILASRETVEAYSLISQQMKIFNFTLMKKTTDILRDKIMENCSRSTIEALRKFDESSLIKSLTVVEGLVDQISENKINQEEVYEIMERTNEIKMLENLASVFQSKGNFSLSRQCTTRAGKKRSTNRAALKKIGNIVKLKKLNAALLDLCDAMDNLEKVNPEIHIVIVGKGGFNYKGQARFLKQYVSSFDRFIENSAF